MEKPKLFKLNQIIYYIKIMKYTENKNLQNHSYDSYKNDKREYYSRIEDYQHINNIMK